MALPLTPLVSPPPTHSSRTGEDPPRNWVSGNTGLTTCLDTGGAIIQILNQFFIIPLLVLTHISFQLSFLPPSTSPHITLPPLFSSTLSFYPHPLHLHPLSVSAARMGDLVLPVAAAAVPPLQAHQPSSMCPSVASELARICIGLGMAPPDFTFIRSRQVRHTHTHTHVADTHIVGKYTRMLHEHTHMQEAGTHTQCCHIVGISFCNLPTVSLCFPAVSCLSPPPLCVFLSLSGFDGVPGEALQWSACPRSSESL